MASNNYTSANVVPAADTFREWVDLTNRITYDMEKVVITVAANTQGARTSGNASVNGYFSANTLIVEHELTGATATATVYGTRAAKDNLIIVSNTVLKANGAATGAILFAQSNAYFSGANVVFGSNVGVNSTSSVFESNATINIFNTPMDINANMDIDNALTQITSTNTVIENGNINITSNVNIDAASIDINDGVLHAGATSINIDSTAVTFTSNAGTNIFNTPLDINANTDVNNALNHITSTNTAIDGGILNIESNTYIGANTLTVNGTSFGISSNVSINSTASFFSSNATTNIFNTPVDINANIDTDNTLSDFTSTTFNVSGTTALVDSTTMNIHGTDLDINSNTNIDGTLTTTNTVYLKGANATIGDANTDVFNVFSNSILNDKLNVKKAVDLDSTLNVDGATTLNGAVTLGDATADPITFTGRVASGINPDSSGDQSLGTASLRWDGMFDDLTADDVIIDTDASVGNDLSVDNNFNVNTAIVYTQSGGVNTTTLGKGTTADSRVNIRGRVNHNLIPFDNTIKLGNTTNRWVISGTSGNFSTTLDVAGITNLNDSTQSSNVTTGALIVDGGVGIAKNLNIGGTTSSIGLATLSAGLVVLGASANVTTFNASDLSSLEEVTVSSTLGVTGAASFASTLGVTGATTLSNTLGVSGATSLSDTLGVTGATALGSTVDVTGAATFASTVDIAGNVTVDGTTVLGDATGDTITLKGYVAGAADGTTLGIVPVSNGARLGISANRWKGLFTTIGTSGNITAGADVDVTSEANTSTLRVRSTSAFEGNSTWSRTGTTGDLTITANTTQHNIGVGGIVCANLVVSGTATLPSDTSLTLSTISGKVFNVADTINLGTGANAVTQVIFGSGAGSGTTANIIFTNAVFSSTFVPRVTNSIDLGTSAKKFRSGIFGTSVSVGTTVANTTSIIAENVYATNDLIGNYSSDHRLKDNVLVIDSALNKVNNISGYSFTWNNKIGDFREGTNDYGVIAQEIEDILPDAVSINSQGNKTVNYNAIIPLLVEAVKELSAKVDYYMQADTEGDKE
jgi:hypothetical protein